MTHVPPRIKKWESLFQKYENAESSHVYIASKNLFEIDSEGDCEQESLDGVKKVVDEIWENDRNLALTRNTRKNASKDCDTSKRFKTKNVMPIEYSSTECSDEEDDDDDDESCESDFDQENAKHTKIGKKEFYAALLETSMCRTQEIRQRREKFPCIFDDREDRQQSHEQGDKMAESSSRFRYLPSQGECLKIDSSKISCFEKDSPGARSPRKSPVTPEGNPSASKEPSNKSYFESNSSGALELRVLLSPIQERNRPENKNSREVCITSKESSFSETLRRLKIHSPSGKQMEPFELKQRMPENKRSSPLQEYSEAEPNATMTTPLTSPVNGDKKRKILRSPEKICCARELFSKKSSGQHSLSGSSGKIISIDSAILRRTLSSERKSIRALTKGRSIFDV